MASFENLRARSTLPYKRSLSAWLSPLSMSIRRSTSWRTVCSSSRSLTTGGGASAFWLAVETSLGGIEGSGVCRGPVGVEAATFASTVGVTVVVGVGVAIATGLELMPSASTADGAAVAEVSSVAIPGEGAAPLSRSKKLGALRDAKALACDASCSILCWNGQEISWM